MRSTGTIFFSQLSKKTPVSRLAAEQHSATNGPPVPAPLSTGKGQRFFQYG
jgi:hypothetical protein